MGCGVSQIRIDANTNREAAGKDYCHDMPPPATASAKPMESKKSTSIDARIVARLHELGTQRRQSGIKMLGFDRIVMKFGLAQNCFFTIQHIYDEYYDEKKNGLDFDGLKRAMDSLGARMSEKDMTEIFYESDMVRDNSLSCNEFVVSLAISYLLGLIQNFDSASKIVSGPLSLSQPPPEERTGSQGSAPGSEGAGGDNFEAEASAKTIHNGLELMVTAYLTFDDDCSGTIQLSEVRKVMQQHGETSHHSKVKRERSSRITHQIRDERIREMDVDQNGTISFQEFVLTFQKWIGCDDE